MSLRCWLCCLLLAVTLVPGWAAPTAPAPTPAPPAKTYEPKPEPVLKMVPLHSATYDEVLPLIKDELSEIGTLSYFKPRNAVAVKDYPERVARIVALLEGVDQPAANIRVEVEFLNTTMAKSSGLLVATDPRRPVVTIDHGKVRGPGEVTVITNDSSTSTTRNTTQWVLARSGFPARLWVGETVREPVFLKQYALVTLLPGRAATVTTVPAGVEWEKQDLGASLYVTATYQDSGMIDIELYPVVTYKDPKGTPHAYRVQQISTRVSARNGERVLIGGADQATNSFYRRFLGPTVFAKDSTTDSLSMYLTPFVRVMDRAAPVDRASAPDGGRLPPVVVPR